jgi:hypothetical protein
MTVPESRILSRSGKISGPQARATISALAGLIEFHLRKASLSIIEVRGEEAAHVGTMLSMGAAIAAELREMPTADVVTRLGACRQLELYLQAVRKAVPGSLFEAMDLFTALARLTEIQGLISRSEPRIVHRRFAESIRPARWALGLAVGLLPQPVRLRYAEEYSAESDALSPWRQLGHAFSLLVSAPRIARTMREEDHLHQEG